MWAIWAIIAAVLLGIYDVFKKISLDKNGVLPVLFFAVLTSAFIFSFVIIGSKLTPSFFQGINFYCQPLTVKEHLQILLKSIIVVGSWILAFFALKHLPITIVSPIRATGPIWTLIGALILFAEVPNNIQWVGLIVTLAAFYLLSTTGKMEGIHFTNNKWVWCIIGGTLLGSCSGLYDKFIINAIDRVAVQSWFSIYQVVVMLPVMLFIWLPNRKKYTPFQWRWTIPLIGIFLILTDFFYFYALSYDGAMISIISGIRRSGIVIAFFAGGKLFNEKNIKLKAIYLTGIMIGVLLLVIGSYITPN